ncbi:class I SAM-dependent methyltransferase [Canibacter zhoujuaniae]|uniref:class I SAM-dependent methyltransferase n=1 Tax=Canibacter zhoujuaniae TaxID=2708343 RepID=UPI001421AA64|nr:methyltransferase [Canibacter zhoujuaniae]
MVSEHYFSATPGGEFTPYPISVALGGREHEVLSARGVFSHDGLDRGTAVLLRSVPAPPGAGNLLDIGCGWGAISLDAALNSPELDVFALDVNERALELTARNAEKLALDHVRALRADQLPQDVMFDEIRSNPPIRVGKEVLHSLMRTYLPRLVVGGIAYLVVAKNLGALSFEKWLATEFASTHTVSRFARDKGFHVIAVTRTA